MIVVPVVLALGCQHEPSQHAFVKGSCSEQKVDWTAEQLTTIALGTLETPAGFEVDSVKTWMEDCRIFVSVSWRPYITGGQATVVISAIDGAVLDVFRGL